MAGMCNRPDAPYSVVHCMLQENVSAPSTLPTSDTSHITRMLLHTPNTLSQHTQYQTCQHDLSARGPSTQHPPSKQRSHRGYAISSQARLLAEQIPTCGNELCQQL
jgi:hypothetical protein